jgi:F420-0:gamma-glutamyl ligase-like protein
MKFKIYPIPTGYWTPRTNLISEIVKHLRNRIKVDDFVIISEKSICTATGSIIDEMRVKPSKFSYFLAKIWMRVVWGYVLGAVARLSRRNLQRIRDYPLREGAAHKQVSLEHTGVFASLKHWSEGGIDTTNLPYHFSSIPLRSPTDMAYKIRCEILKKLGCQTNIILGDSDKTFTCRNFHFSTRKSEVKGIHNLGFLGFICGRFLKCKPRSTPLAYVGRNIDVDYLLNLTALANRVRGHGSGRTVWDMAERFNSSPTEVTWEMLTTIPHYPIVVIRLQKKSGPKTS